MSSGGGGVLRVGIPASFRKTIQDIKEIAGKHSDEDIYAMLKECNMDPNETAQKLLYLDTFHEVKRKRDRKNLTVSNQAAERNRWASGMQRRGARGGRGNNYSGYSSNDTGGGQRIGPPKENGTVHIPTSAGIPGHVHHSTKNDDAPYETSSSNGSSRPTSLGSGSSVYEGAPHYSEGDISKAGQEASSAGDNKSEKRPLPHVAVKLLQNSNPGPTPTSTPTTTTNAASEAGYEGRNSEPTSIFAPIPVSVVYSSASDPVLLPPLNPRNPGAVGTMKCEAGIQKIAPELSETALPESRLKKNQDGVRTDQVDPVTMASNRKTVTGAVKDQYSEPSKPSSLLSQNNTTAAAPHQDGWSSKQANGSLNVMTHMGTPVLPQANMPSLPKVDDSLFDQATSQLNRKLEDLNITSQKPVIFPDHVQVPEAFRNGLTFGSLDGSFGQENSANEDAKLDDITTMGNEDNASEPSLSHEIASATAHEGEYPDHLQSFPHMPGNLPVLEVNVSPTGLPSSESSKPEIMLPIGGSPYSFLPTVPDYGFSMMPPIVAPHLVRVEETEVSDSSVSSQPSTQTTVGQNTTAVSPPLFPYLRQPYPSNYFPYNPYFPHLYMPPNAPQLFGHSGFAQQASTGNIYMPPQAAGTGVKFPVPQIYKPPGTVAANLTHFGIPSGYSPYGTSMLGYGIAATVTAGSSSSTEDLTAPELKDKSAYPVLKQNEETQGWTSAPARDLQSLQANFFYNFPHGQHVTYSPAPSGQGSIAGMYHLTPTTAAPSMTQTLPQHSQVMIGSVDPVLPPAGTYQQPHSRTGWNPKLLNRENI